MPRPCKCRRVCGKPQVDYFKPRGVPLAALEEVALGVDEYEAVRLADLLELYQDEAARRMGVSRQTFGNIVAAARKKIADAVVNGKALKIAGGAVRFGAPGAGCLRGVKRRGAGFPGPQKNRTTTENEGEKNESLLSNPDK